MPRLPRPDDAPPGVRIGHHRRPILAAAHTILVAHGRTKHDWLPEPAPSLAPWFPHRAYTIFLWASPDLRVEPEPPLEHGSAVQEVELRMDHDLVIVGAWTIKLAGEMDGLGNGGAREILGLTNPRGARSSLGWVQLQLQNHLAKFWEDGIKD
ncbi:uncharacterized protein LOC119328053 isoform X2 [Triticum dicoccoides]|uniref:uncharacterized protein LOC119328053 isoform X2 n=1 Tax=Triticum dicoccoides TaxID=85692 RepID=UPI00189109C9|nr:uncharacterized protein LOC119328053 isoform X2 [Triticum dicoccoides]